MQAPRCAAAGAEPVAQEYLLAEWSEWWTGACFPADECHRRNSTAESSGAGSLAVRGNQVGLRWCPGPGADIRLQGDHVDAVNGAGLYAQVAAGAFAFDDGVHMLGGPEDGVYRAGLDRSEEHTSELQSRPHLV